MEKFESIEMAWGFKLPAEFKGLYEVPGINAVKLSNGIIMDLPCPLMKPEEIAQQAALADDWEVPIGLVPFLGDMHSLLCLDFRQGGVPPVVLLNDARNITLLFSTISGFISAITPTEESNSEPSGVDKSKSWLGF